MTSTTPDKSENANSCAEIDHDRWPALAMVPKSALRTRAAQLIFKRAVSNLDVRVVFPDGRTLGAGNSSSPRMWIKREKPFFARLGADGLIGFGESYMAKDWEADERNGGLAGLLTIFAERFSNLVPAPVQRLRRWFDKPHPDTDNNSISGARNNIHRHYDLSNELFKIFLDETMTYSSAWFREGDSLADAQRRKVDGILDFANVKEGTHVLEIGTGWGALAIRAAGERKARVTTITISQEQKTLAEQRISEAGLSNQVDVQLLDYRQVRGNYDAVVSVEMIEAVGGEYWPTYFSTIDRVLKPHGRAAIQAITMAHDRMLATKNSYTWIHKYIFPGGLIPSHTAIEQVLRGHTALKVVGRRDLGVNYAETLRQWRERFLNRWDDVHKLGFDNVFRRMWEFYLAYSEAGFRSEYIGVSQLALAKG